MEESRSSAAVVDPPSPAGATRAAGLRSNSNSSRSGSIRADGGWRRRAGATSIFVVALAAVLAASALAWQLMGASVVVHFLVLLCYGFVFLSLGAFLVRPATTKQAVPKDPPASPSSPLEVSASSSRGDGSIGGGGAGDGSRGGGNDDAAGNCLVSANNGDAVGGSTGVPSQVHSSRTASPMHWVGETVEGSLNWLRGGVGASGSNGAGGRRRSRSMGGPLLLGTEGTVSGAGSAATSPGGSMGRGGNASPTSGMRIGFGRAAAEAALGRALPALGAGIPQGQLARARAWSRTFGSGGQGSPLPLMAAAAGGSGGLAIDAYDGDDSVDGDGGDGGGGDRGMMRAGGGAGGDWLVGAGMGDER